MIEGACMYVLIAIKKYILHVMYRNIYITASGVLNEISSLIPKTYILINEIRIYISSERINHERNILMCDCYLPAKKWTTVTPHNYYNANN